MPKRMDVQGAMDLVDDDLPDGAFFAMVAEMSGVEYGEIGAHIGAVKKLSCSKKSFALWEVRKELEMLERESLEWTWKHYWCKEHKAYHVGRMKKGTGK